MSAGDLTRLRAALAEGKRPTVYLRDAVPSLGIDAASSARVVSVDAETVTVRPKGIGDDVPFEAAELYPSRAAAASAAATASAAPAPRRAARGSRTAATARRQAAAQTASVAAAQTQDPAPVTVTLKGSADGEWTVQCAAGTRAGGPARPVPAEAVSRAVAALGDEGVSATVADVLAHARRSAARRVAELSEELERAQLALDALDRQPR